MRAASVFGLVLAGLLLGPVVYAKDKTKKAETEGRYDAQWIWFDSGSSVPAAPVGKVWFRREVRAYEPSTGDARVLCDDRFTIWVNGQKIGQGDGGKLYRFNLNGIVERGPNVVAVEAENLGGRAGLFIDGEIRSQGGQSIPFDTGEGWMATRTAPVGTTWLQPKFDARSWTPAKILGPHAQSPWNSIVLRETYLDRFNVPPGYELIRIGEPKLAGSLVAMTWGNRGRLIVSRERGPIFSAIDDDGDGIYDRVIEFTDKVTNCQGLCTVGDDLYAVGGGPKGVGVYRLPDKNHDDKADDVQLVEHSKGSMGDHGPHDVVFGPDGWLYHNMGNHAWITQKPEPTSPCRNYDEDYLLVPKFEDAGGHAAGIKAPGGTIWRFTPDGKHWWCETNGFRNEYDFAFNAAGDLFSFDSDMEWDVGAFWYRPIRVTHCIPGAEFGWRSGAAKWPPYYFDSLPGTVDIGRGSPTGVVFYEHTQFPKKLRGNFLICDWSMGRILAVDLKKAGATYKGSYETLLNGNPLNVSDIEVDRDGSVVFVTGGRNTEGGIYRLRSIGGSTRPVNAANVTELLALPQIESAWAREIAARVKSTSGPRWKAELTEAANSEKPFNQIRALTLLNQLGPKPDIDLLLKVSKAKDPTVRAFATHLVGFHTGEPVRQALVRLLSDPDATVRRRACEGFVSSGAEAPVAGLLAALGSDDRWLRFAARIAMERVPRDKWFDQVIHSPNLHIVCEGLLAFYRRDRQGSATTILKLIAPVICDQSRPLTKEMKLTALRLVQLALLQKVRNADSERIGRTLFAEFPAGKTDIDAETARILAMLNVNGAAAKILRLVETAPNHGEQLHYALTLRYLNAGWTLDLERRLMDWYDGTRGWEGGNSLTGYVSNVVAAIAERFTPYERRALIAEWVKHPAASALIVRTSQPDQIANFEGLIASLIEGTATSTRPAQEELIGAAIQSMGKSQSSSVRATLRKLYEHYPDRRESIARAIAENPIPSDLDVLVRTLRFADETTMQLCLGALSQIDSSKAEHKPKDPETFRTVIQAGLKLGDRGGRAAAGLLKDWTGVDHKAGRNASKAIAFYQKWYSDKFPTSPVPELPKDDASKSKYTYQQLADILDHGNSGNVNRGREIFTKARCVKCHRFQNEGESVGPDLTSIRRRFQRKEIVESLLFPSQVISDQYRMVQVVTTEGLVYVGMPIPGASKKKKGTLVLLLSDATKLEIPKVRIDEQIPSKTSVMPAGLLDTLSVGDIADLFAFLETSKFNAAVAEAPKK